MLYRSLSFQIISFITIIFILAMGITIYTVIKTHGEQSIKMVTEEGMLLSNTIKKSTKHAMLENRKDDVQKIIETIGTQEGIEKVRIFNKEGKVIVADNKKEIGKSVDKEAESCIICHTKEQEKKQKLYILANSTRIFKSKKGYRVLGIINPIYNEKICYPCHSPKKKVLGVLDIIISLDKIDKQMDANRNTMILLTLLTISVVAVCIGLFIHRFVQQPIKQLMEGTKKIAEGDFDIKILVNSRNETFELAKAFNRMAKALKQSKEEIEQWGKTLEQKVKEATEDLQKANEQLTELDKEKSEFMLKVSHEIKAPLSAICGAVKVILRRLIGDITKEQAEMLEVVDRRAKGLLSLVDDLLELSQVKMGKITPNLENIQLVDILKKTIALMRSKVEEKRIVIKVNFPPSLPNVLANSENIEELCTNLISNAIKYTPQNGEINISANVEEDNIKVQISDTGIGIEEDDLPRIFEEFYRSKNAKMFEKDGTGLGLSIAKQVVEVHKGKIWVESEGKDKGSKFIFTLPINKES